MIGLLYLVFFLIYGGISYLLVKAVVRWAKGRGRRSLLWGGATALLMYSLVFWDWLPMEVAFHDDCGRYAGFTQYKSLEAWKKENPGVAETLVPVKNPRSERHGDVERYVLNQRFAWEIRRRKHPLYIVERDERIVDLETGEVLARYVDFSTDIQGVETGSGKTIADYKIWLGKRSCERDVVSRGKFYRFKYLLKHQKEFEK